MEIPRAHLYTVTGGCALPGAVAYYVRDGELLSPNPLCAPRSQTPALRLFVSPELIYPSPKGGLTYRYFSLSCLHHPAQ